jgi:hypothetical protein
VESTCCGTNILFCGFVINFDSKGISHFDSSWRMGSSLLAAAAPEPSRAFDVARLDKEKWGTNVWETPSAWRMGLFLQIYDETRNMIIKRRLVKVSSIFSTPTASRERLNLTSLSKTKDRTLSSNLTEKARLPSLSSFANDTPSLNASCSLLLWRVCATTSARMRL